jgi:hypothetical protein
VPGRHPDQPARVRHFDDRGPVAEGIGRVDRVAERTGHPHGNPFVSGVECCLQGAVAAVGDGVLHHLEVGGHAA